MRLLQCHLGFLLFVFLMLFLFFFLLQNIIWCGTIFPHFFERFVLNRCLLSDVIGSSWFQWWAQLNSNTLYLHDLMTWQFLLLLLKLTKDQNAISKMTINLFLLEWGIRSIWWHDFNFHFEMWTPMVYSIYNEIVWTNFYDILLSQSRNVCK